MVSPHSYAFDRDRWPTDWRAVSVAVAFHALLLTAFVLSRLHAPAVSGVERTVFVSLLDSVPRLEVRRTSAIDAAAALPKPNPVRSKSTADRSRPLPQTSKVVPEGRDAPVDGDANGAGATTLIAIAGTGVAQSQSMFGSGSARGPRFRPARVLHRSQMHYPTDAFTAHQEGSVDVIVDIATDGRPVEGHVQQSSGSSALDAAAVAGVLQWTFRPAERNGAATQAQAIVTIDWTIGPAEIEHFAQLGIRSSQSDMRLKPACLSAKNSELCKDMDDLHRRR